MVKITENQVILPEDLSKKIQNKLKKDLKNMSKKDFVALVEFMLNELYDNHSLYNEKRLDLVFDLLREQFVEKKANEKR